MYENVTADMTDYFDLLLSCYSGSGVPNKKPNAATRAHLERKLNKKLTDLTDQRKSKPSDKK